MFYGSCIFSSRFANYITFLIEGGFPDEIPYTRLRLIFLTDLAKTLIPTISGFIALMGAGAAYLHKGRFLLGYSFQVGVFAVFALAVVSLACWVSVLTAAVDAARVFNETGFIDGLTRDNIQFYSNVYRGGRGSADRSKHVICRMWLCRNHRDETSRAPAAGG